MFGLGPFEMMVIGVIAVVLFGGNLPEVARKLGGSYRELRRGLNEVQQQFRAAEHEVSKSLSVDEPSKSSDSTDEDEPDEPTVPKFAAQMNDCDRGPSRIDYAAVLAAADEKRVPDH